MPRSESPLDELAEKMGIAAEFLDARGSVICTGADTKRKLLRAMGVEVTTDEQVRAALQALDRAAWTHTLAPVKVLRGGLEPLELDLVLPRGTGSIAWRMLTEEGAELSGEVSFEQLRLVADICLDDCTLERRRLPLEAKLPWGYHRLSIEPSGAAMTLIVCPEQCWLPELTQGERLWGITAQLYLLRSEGNWGIGDFSDLAKLVAIAGANGADVVGLNPLHSLLSDDPQHASPYSPASRLLLNVSNIDVTAIAELRTSAHARELIAATGFRAQVEACRAADLVDYAAVADLKLQVLRALFEECRGAADQRRWAAFKGFQRDRAGLLELGCVFLALRDHFLRESPERADWHQWPAEFRDATSGAVQRFAREHRVEVDFLAWLQWIAEGQLAGAQAAARESGMRVGLYRDLAVGADRAGAETWSNPRAVISEAHIGAPPDIYNPAGQDWGLPPFNPRALREENYRSFVELIRANMRCAGGLRIDHVMGLQQLYWIAHNDTPMDGAYVRYPIDDLLGILALESQRHRCIVVGEDLGTVPANFRERMSQTNILSYRVLLFEQDPQSGEFRPPEAYPPLSLAVSGSHDLPTLRGWWQEGDLDLKEKLGLFPTAGEASRQRESRRRDRVQLLEALRREKLIDTSSEPDIGTFVRAVHEFLSRTNSLLAMVQLDDLTDEAEPVNVPGTWDEYPNWRRRLSINLEELLRQPRFTDIVTLFAAERELVRAPGREALVSGTSDRPALERTS
jgi:4-alpha-glucanotransferase